MIFQMDFVRYFKVIQYKVCIGAYGDKNNALNQFKLAKEKGFSDAYII